MKISLKEFIITFIGILIDFYREHRGWNARKTMDEWRSNFIDWLEVMRRNE